MGTGKTCFDQMAIETLRIVVAFPPGGLTDAYARMYAEQITTQLGVPAVVENRPGAGASSLLTMSQNLRPMATRCS